MEQKNMDYGVGEIALCTSFYFMSIFIHILLCEATLSYSYGGPVSIAVLDLIVFHINSTGLVYAINAITKAPNCV